MGIMNSGLFTSNVQTWETPKELFDKLNNVFNFDLDVCAVKETAKCAKYFTPEIDGLAQQWSGNCWMNPPYGREQIKWITKAYEEYANNSVTTICLIPARPDTKAWQDIIFPNAKAVCFIRGRLKFSNSKDSAPFPSALVVFSSELTKSQELLLKELGALANII